MLRLNRYFMELLWLVSLFVMAYTTTTSTTASIRTTTPVVLQETTTVESGPFKCPSTTTALKNKIIHCLGKGEKFLSNYFRKYMKKKFSKCSEYRSFGKCINPLLINCPQTAQILPKEWMTTIELMNCDCDADQRKKCGASLKCMKHEMTSLFIARCGTLYTHNMRQKTQSRCHFMTEYIQCQETVIRSACGKEAGTFLYLALKIAAWNQYECDIRRWTGYNGFEYNAGCPRNFSAIMNKCSEQSLAAKVLAFNEDNNLIPMENERAITLACMEYQRYQTCIAPYNTSCPKGVNSALEYNVKLRIYLMKMEYICDTTKQNFAKHVQCYQSVQEKGHLNKCVPHWKKIDEWLQNITAFQYYCKPQDNLRQVLANDLKPFQECYKEKFKANCDEQSSEEAASLMGGLITKAFTDPHYLKLQHKPDCELHTMDNLSSRTTGQHRHRHNHNKHKGRHKTKLKSLENSVLDKRDKKEVRTAYSAYKGEGHCLSFNTMSTTLLVLFGVCLNGWLL